MKKVIFILAVFSLLTVVSYSKANAKFATSPGEIKREEMRTKLTDRQTKEERKASIEAKVVETRNLRISSYWLHIKKVLSSFIARLNNVISRIELRIAKVDSEGGSANTAKAKEEVQKAKNLISDASLKITNIDTNLSTALTTENPKNSFNLLIKDIKAIRKDLKDAHTALTHVIGSIKGLRVKADDQSDDISGTPSATVTGSVTPTATITGVITATLTPTTNLTATLTPTP